MSRLFGAVRQMGFVVRDIDKAMRHWVEVCGVGPWFVADKLPLDGFWYKEQPYDIHLTVALANSGDVPARIDRATRRDAEHVSRLARRRTRRPAALVELAGELSRAARAGDPEWLDDRPTRRNPARAFRLFPNEGHPGTVIEIAELTPTQRRIFEGVRAAAVDWQGSDPIRHDWPRG